MHSLMANDMNCNKFFIFHSQFMIIQANKLNLQNHDDIIGNQMSVSECIDCSNHIDDMFHVMLISDNDIVSYHPILQHTYYRITYDKIGL